MKYLHIILSAWLLVGANFLGAQETGIEVNTDWDHERHSWQSHWITHPEASTLDFGVFLFRNAITLDELPESLIVHLSADNRYKLYVNGEMVCTGPAKGTFDHWRYETVDLRPWLKKGENILAAEVFNLGEHRPVALFSRQTAFIFQVEDAGPGISSRELNTPGSWKVIENKAYSPIPVSGQTVGGYYVAGPTDRFQADQYPWGWKAAGFNMDEWMRPRNLGKGVGRGYLHGVNWLLVPRNIPPMESREIRFEKIARSSIKDLSKDFLSGEGSLVIPAESRATILLDQSYLTVGYPVIRFGEGAGSTIRITYAESLRDAEGSKGNRNEIEGKEMLGYYDMILPDGSPEREFQPLWLRTWRYVQLDITTGKDSLKLHEIYGIYQAYPFEEVGSFSSDDPLHSRIWEVGWRTARLCAGETYMDCPYYEQLQYLGDTRIQALISLYVSGDDRLMRNALETADQSRMPEGLTLSRGPSAVTQVIPAFSLYWVDMVHDYYMYRSDDAFIRQFLPGIQSVLGWFERRIDSTGLLGPLEWFNFADWTDGFMVGSPPGVDLGHSALVSLNYVYALTRAAELFDHFGQTHQAGVYREQADRTRKAVYDLCYDHERGLLADIPLNDRFQLDLYPGGIWSQHTNIWGILTDAIPLPEQAEIMERILSDSTLTPTTIYFRFYLFQALRKTGMADRYTTMLDSWERMLNLGLTTFQEGDYKDRSDCHAWSASPLYDFLATVAGVTPAEPGFRSVRIEPSLGELNNIHATVPHPQGVIELKLRRNGAAGISGTLSLPGNLDGIFIWNGETTDLHPGLQQIEE